MDRHRCKLCSRIFYNGRALGGHMRSHLATLPLPSKKRIDQLGGRTQSDSSSTRSEHERDDHDENNVNAGYVLTDNPKRSVKASDPEFFYAGSVVQDRESETESTHNPTRGRSKRCANTQTQRLSGSLGNEIEFKKLKSVGVVKSPELTTESTPVSSVSDPSQDEVVARCLMMLSRDVWVRRVVTVSDDNSVDDTNDSAELKTRTVARRGRFKCLGCKKAFRSNKALAGQKVTNKECQQENMKCGVEETKIYECPFCCKVFGSGQALGGHKRSHLLGSSTNINLANNTNFGPNVDKIVVGDTTSFVLDLNLPAPVDDDEDQSQFDFH